MDLAVEGLGVTYGRRRVLEVGSPPPFRAGEVTALIGPNAAGKSTFLRAVAGLARPDTGRVRVGGTDVTNMTLAARAAFTRYVPQVYATSARLSVFDAVLVAAKAAARAMASGGGGMEADVARVLSRVGIEALSERFLCDLSGGQQQLVAIAQGLVRPAPVLMLDEPTSALDLRNQLEALRLLRDAAAREACVVIVAMHDLSLAARHADRVVLLRNGRVAADGTPDQVFTGADCPDTYGVDVATTRSTTSGALMIEASLR
jgi:iron complex transport system ATP-binding protein